MSTSTPYVFLHPLGADRHFWDPVRAELDGPSVALDLPGHGQASPPPLGADITAYTECVVQQIKQVGEPVHLAGMSLGGLVAIEIVSKHRELVASLAFVDAVAVYPEAMQSMWRDRARTAREGALETLVDPMVAMWFTPELAASGDARVEQARATFAATDPEGYARSCDLLATTDLSDQIPTLDVPAIAVCGTDDAPPFLAAATWFGEVTGAPVHLIPGKHACVVEAPEQFAAVLRSTALNPR
ncbi:alpha/beta fold hydrolase [Mycobacterium sp. 236(2023)]|uniref:alpha/beta fold hydrolase n=1 Tax=Mycobacterium sp. 236(2023) TaxID=3038163 RepID=UPI00241519F5|nr:alpha/beta fold hydrolase [Mycobacterium sp. 236(2023)]MDG4666134.1 alpha/beta fold hydrolase [Mycobacterium sp. 236(2023)]